MNLSAQFKDFLLGLSEPPSKVTVKNYISDVNKFIRWAEAKLNKDFHPEDINPILIDSFKKDSLNKYSASSVDRSLSSLRKFFYFLKLEGQISHSPFEQPTSSAEARALSDPWRIRDFKNHLYVFNASSLTIKNYIIDLKQFLNWLEKVSIDENSWEVSESNIFSRLNAPVIEEYKKRLLNEARLSPVSVNRKLSSIRRYVSWANEEGLLRPQPEISNVKERKIEPEGKIENLKFEIENSRVYSGFPPLRLAQKTKNGLVNVFDSLLIYPLANIIEASEQILWVIKGRPVFTDRFSQIKKHLPAGKAGIAKDPWKSVMDPLKSISNVPKSFYAPALISTKYLPLHKKIWHHARNTRPKWYKKYHSYPFVSYLHFSILMLFISIMGYILFDSFNPKKQPPTLAALPSAPPRILSFQGRLTDSSDNPITSQTTLRMAIYNNETSSGSALLWQEVVSPTPDKDGIFSIILGKNRSIPQSLFRENSALWLGVSVGRTSELTPRQQIATVAYAANAETLQGLPPITNTSSTSNVVLALNSSGNLTIGGTANPTFQATGGTFTLSGKAVSITTTTSSNGNIVLNPDGTGKIDLQKVLQNTSNNNSLVPGSVQVDDQFSVNTTSSGPSLNISQSSSGDLIIASTSGLTKFRVSNSGAITNSTWNANKISSSYGGTGLDSSGSTGVPFISSGTWSIDTNYLFANHGGTGQTSYSVGDILYATSSSALARLGVGTTSQCLVGGTSPSWASCNSATTSDFFWNQTNGALYPHNSTVDFLIGGQATTSAKFGLLNINSGTPTASISANSGNNAVFLTGLGNLGTTNKQTLTLGGPTTGLINIANSADSSLTTFDTVNSRVGIGTTTPVSELHVTRPLSFGVTGKALAIFDQIESQDILTASASGTTRFTLANDGDLTLTGGDTITASSLSTITTAASLGITATTLTLGNGSAATIATTTNGLTLDSGSNTLTIASSDTTLTASGITTISLGTSPTINAAATALNLQADGTPDVNIAGGSGTTGCTISNATGNLTCTGNISGGSTGIQGYWQRASGALASTNITDDLLLGATSTASSKFAFLNVAGGTPTASISANLGSNATTLTGLGVLGTTNMQTLTLGNSTTGNIVIDSGSGVVNLADSTASRFILTDANKNLTFSGLSQVLIDTLSDETGSGVAVFGTSPAITTSLTTPSTTFSLVNTTATTVNFAGAATTLSIGASTGTTTINNNASVSGTLTLAGAARSIQTTANNTLTIGGDTSGNIVLSPLNSASGARVTPGADNLVSLGSSPSGRFKDIFLGSGSVHIQCTTGDGCGQGLDYAMGVNTSTGTFSIGVNGTTAVGNPLLNIMQGGNVGIGTTAPAVKLESYVNAAADTAALRLSNANTDGFGANLEWWSGYGGGKVTSYIRSQASGSQGGFWELFVRDQISNALVGRIFVDNAGKVAFGTTSPISELHVTRPLSFGATGKALAIFDQIENQDIFTASASGTTRFVIQNNGDVGIGRTDPRAPLEINAGIANLQIWNCNSCSDAYYLNLIGNNPVGGTIGWQFNLINNSVTYTPLQMENGNVGINNVRPNDYTLKVNGQPAANGYTAFTNYSDARLKENVSSFSDGVLDKIMQLRPTTSNYNDKYFDVTGYDRSTKSKTLYGFIAQELQSVFPEMVTQRSDGYLDTNLGHLSIYLVKAIQEQQKEIEKLSELILDVQLADTGDLVLTPTIDENFEIQRDGRAIDRIGAFSDLVVARIKSGYFETGKLIVTGSLLVKNITSETLASSTANFSQLSTDSLAVATENFSIAGQTLRDYIAAIVSDVLNNRTIEQSNNQLAKADIVSPLSEEPDGKIAIKLNDNQGKSKLEIKNASGSAVASFDSEGNATFSGTLTAERSQISKIKSQKLDTEEATVSGILRAEKIIANQIELSEEGLLSLLGLEPQSSSSSTLLASSYEQTASNSPISQWSLANYISSTSASFDNLFALRATFEQGLLAFGPASFFEASVADRLFVGSQLILADKSINVLGSNLELQPLKQGGIAFVGGQVEIDTDGNLKVNGNAYFAKDVQIHGKLGANIISPLPDKDLVIELGSMNQESSGSTHNSSFIIHDSSKSAVLTINNQGNLSASGAGTFSKLNLNIINEAQAISPTEVIATGSAGTAQIQPNRNELTIKNPLVTENSLIYITPKTATPNQSVYLLRQVPEQPTLPGVEGSFTVGISQPVNKRVPFNWIIIN